MVLLLQINAAELGLRRNILRGFEECSIRLCWKREREGKLRDRGGRQAGDGIAIETLAFFRKRKFRGVVRLHCFVDFVQESKKLSNKRVFYSGLFNESKKTSAIKKKNKASPRGSKPDGRTRGLVAVGLGRIQTQAVED